MAESIIKTDIFKFVALRPPVSINKKDQETFFFTDKRTVEKTPIGELVLKDDTHIIYLLREFINSRQPEINNSKESAAITKLIDIASSFNSANFSTDKLNQLVESSLGTSVKLYSHNSETKKLLDMFWDLYYAYYILSKNEPQNFDIVTKTLRAFHLLQVLYDSQISNFEDLQKVLSAKPIISNLFSNRTKTTSKPQNHKEEEKNDSKLKEYNKLWVDIIDTHKAIDEIKSVQYENNSELETNNLSVTGKGKITYLKNRLSINEKNFDNMGESTKLFLNNFNTVSKNFQITEPLSQLQIKLDKLYSIANNINDPDFIKKAPQEANSFPGFSSLIGNFKNRNKEIPTVVLLSPNSILPSIKPLGIGELKVVKQVLKKYETGEVAHIENVLRGEYKERKHRILDRTEDIFTFSTETEEENTKDTQTTERFELKKESEKTIEEKMSVEAGITVSGSYGMVTFGAYGDFAYSTSSQESNKSSANFAREVIDKSVSRIQKKTKEERTTKKLHEVEEINTHGIDNKDKTDHAVGIYRWVDKYYEAQIYNYGKRLMFEFIIPEPSAFFEFTQTHQPKKNIIPPIAPYKWNFDGNEWKTDGSLITHKDITEQNFQNYIRDYNVLGATTPPVPYKTISTAITKEGMTVLVRDEQEKDRKKEGPSFSLNNKELIVPAGYKCNAGVWFDVSAIWTAFPKMELTIGNKIFRILDHDRQINEDDSGFDERFLAGNNSNNDTIPFHTFYPESIIQVSVNCSDVLSYSINLYALVERLPETYEQWQILTYEKIMTAYKAMQLEYEQKVAAQEVQQGIMITGQNPKINREIEKTEFKKQCIKMLMDTDTSVFGTFDAMKDNGSNPPDFDITDALQEGKIIQFFEQAFEWENITYLFYSYFWSRKKEWLSKSVQYNNDPIFTKFLQAGSARVVIPVRPGYNDVVTHYMQTGEIWGEDGNPPLIKNKNGSLNDLYIAIADELRNQTDDLAGAIAEGAPWEVILPTTLVYLQNNADLPIY